MRRALDFWLVFLKFGFDGFIQLIIQWVTYVFETSVSWNDGCKQVFLHARGQHNHWHYCLFNRQPMQLHIRIDSFPLWTEITYITFLSQQSVLRINTLYLRLFSHILFIILLLMGKLKEEVKFRIPHCKLSRNQLINSTESENIKKGTDCLLVRCVFCYHVTKMKSKSIFMLKTERVRELITVHSMIEPPQNNNIEFSYCFLHVHDIILNELFLLLF